MRKTAIVKIEDQGRDRGKEFVINEMSAAQAEKWGMRLLFAMGQSNAQIPANIAEAGLAGVAALGLRAVTGLPWNLAEPLLDEMMRCVSIRPDPRNPQVVRPLLVDDDIFEVATLVKLREEILSLHLGFSIAAWISDLAIRRPVMGGDMPTTATSPAP